jgi:AraC-like DNA-binding protein
VPDNNVDFIFNLNNVDENSFVVPFHSPALFEIQGPVSYFGIRLRVLAQQWLTSIPVGEWGNSSFNDILSNHLLYSLYESIETGDNFHNRCNRIGKVLLASFFYRGIDKRLVNFVRFAHQHASLKIDLSDKQCSEFALSARHLRRLCHLYLGLSPRNFNRVLRFQNTLHQMNTVDTSSAWAGTYYDQSHFIREFRSLTGLTPGDFMNMSVLYNTTDHST